MRRDIQHNATCNIQTTHTPCMSHTHFVCCIACCMLRPIVRCTVLCVPAVAVWYILIEGVAHVPGTVFYDTAGTPHPTLMPTGCHSAGCALRSRPKRGHAVVQIRCCGIHATRNAPLTTRNMRYARCGLKAKRVSRCGSSRAPCIEFGPRPRKWEWSYLSGTTGAWSSALCSGTLRQLCEPLTAVPVGLCCRRASPEQRKSTAPALD